MSNDRGALEGAIMDAEGSMALLTMVEEALLVSTDAGPNRLGIQAPEGVYVFALDVAEYGAISRAINLLHADLKAVSKAFYAMPKGRAS